MNLIEGIQKELERNKELLEVYRGLGQPGMFGAGMIQHKIKEAEHAITNCDTVKMLRCFKRLQDSQ